MQRRQTWRGALPFLVGLIAAPCASCAEDRPACGATDPGRETICVSRRGGQTGMEGSCLLAPEPELPSVDAARALVEGTHRTTLAYRPERRSLGVSAADVVGLPMTVVVEPEGDARAVGSAGGELCQSRIRQDVKVTLRFDEPPLDVVIETTADAFSSTFAVVVEEVGRDVSEALGLPPVGATFSLAFNANGMEGSIEPHGESCGSAVFPADARCPEWPRIEVGLDRDRDGFRPRDALRALDELGDVPLRWSDGGETTLSVALVEAPEWACSGEWLESFSPETLDMLLSVRAVSADARLDAVVPAELSVQVSTAASVTAGTGGMAGGAGVVQSLRIIASNVGVPAGELAADVVPSEPAETGLTLRLWKTPDGAYAEGGLFALELSDPGLTPPIDATIDPARAGCVAAPPVEIEVETGVETGGLDQSSTAN